MKAASYHLKFVEMEKKLAYTEVKWGSQVGASSFQNTIKEARPHTYPEIMQYFVFSPTGEIHHIIQVVILYV